MVPPSNPFFSKDPQMLAYVTFQCRGLGKACPLGAMGRAAAGDDNRAWALAQRRDCVHCIHQLCNLVAILTRHPGPFHRHKAGDAHCEKEESGFNSRVNLEQMCFHKAKSRLSWQDFRTQQGIPSTEQ